MSRKLLLLTALIIVIAGTLGLAFKVERVESGGTIYIRADGSIVGPANITTVDYVTYYFNESNYDEIVVERDNIIIDGAGHTVEASGTGIGFDLTMVNNVTIRNTNIKNFDRGIRLDGSSNNNIVGNNITATNWASIYLWDSSNNSVVGNTITNNGGDGIYLYGSSNNNIADNNFTANYWAGIGFWNSSNNSIVGNVFVNDGLLVEDSYGNVVEHNTVNGKPLVYLEGVQDYSVGDAGQVILVNCDNITVENLNISNINLGLELWNTNNCSITGNTITNNQYGMRLCHSSNNSIVANSVAGQWGGILLWDSSNNNNIVDNNIENNEHGISLSDSSNNSIVDNNIVDNKFDGIDLYDSSNNSIVDNNITATNWGGITLWISSNNSIVANTIENNYYGIRLHDASSNQFYHNNFIDNAQQVNIEVSGYGNFWNNTLEGNYWSDYNDTDSDRDGIGDTPYQIDANNTDNHPLMGMFSSFNTSVGKYVNVISNSTIDDFEYFQDDIKIRMYVSNMTSNQTHGFCRICIPHALMTEPYNATVDGANPTYWNYTLYDDGDNRWIYFSYQHSILEIVIIPEFPSFLIMPLFMMATLLAVLVLKKRKHLLARTKRI